MQIGSEIIANWVSLLRWFVSFLARRLSTTAFYSMSTCHLSLPRSLNRECREKGSSTCTTRSVRSLPRARPSTSQRPSISQMYLAKHTKEYSDREEESFRILQDPRQLPPAHRTQPLTPPGLDMAFIYIGIHSCAGFPLRQKSL